ncbi:MAG TPA: hypothetical protein VF625_17130 [Longimicrobium sp.]|jgi:hypothetical protein
MRKWIFWGITVAAVLVTLAGLLGTSPDVGGADGTTVDRWYADRVAWVGLFGALAGGVAAGLAHRIPKHSHDDAADVFLERVAGWGVSGLAGAALVAFLYTAVCAAAFSSNLAELDRVVALIPTLRGAALVGEAVLVAAVVFGLGTTARQWGGRPSLYLR